MHPHPLPSVIAACNAAILAATTSTLSPGRRRYTSSFAVLSLLLATLFAAPGASARIRNVPEEYETIQAGIDAAEEGDTVLVQPGRYEENPLSNEQPIVVQKSPKGDGK